MMNQSLQERPGQSLLVSDKEIGHSSSSQSASQGSDKNCDEPIDMTPKWKNPQIISPEERGAMIMKMQDHNLQEERKHSRSFKLLANEEELKGFDESRDNGDS